MARLRDSRLAERDEELAEVQTAINASRDGCHRVLLVQGAAGMGKTRLLSELRRRALAAGLRTLTARGSYIERSFAFGVVRQLFEAHLVALEDHHRASALSGQARAAVRPLGLESSCQPRPDSDVQYAALNGLYWLCANLAQHGPVALIVDDAHWADEPSLRWIAFAAARLHDVPVLMALAARVCEPGADTRILTDLASLDHVRQLALRPLSTEAIASLLQQTCGARPQARFVRSCQRATGGNPFLLDELIEQIHQRGIALTDTNAQLVPAMGSTRIAEAVLFRVQRLGANAVALTRATSVLGLGARFLDAAQLAGLDQASAAAAAGGLADAGIMTVGLDLAFVHPLVRAAVYDAIPSAERLAAHARAARLLADRNGCPQSVGGHLLHAPPSGEPWVVDWLRAAAREACAQGSPRDAIAYLTRALAEPLSDTIAATVLCELGTAKHHANDRTATEHLMRALDLVDSPDQRATIGLTLARAIWTAGRIPEAVSLLEDLVDSLDEHLTAPLEAELIAIARLHPQTRAVGVNRSARLDPGKVRRERLLLANVAFDQAVSAQLPAGEIAALVHRALGDGAFLQQCGSENTVYHLAAWALAQADQLPAAQRALQAALDLARTEGSIVGYARALNFLADVRFRAGRLRDAEADARGSLEHLTPVRAPLAVAFLIAILIERDELDQADHLLQRFGLAGELPATILATFLLERRARLRLAQGRPEAALADLLLCQQRSLEWGAHCPAFLPWRSSTALALHRTEDTSRARALAAEEVQKAQAFGAPGALGSSLRTHALLADKTHAPALLHDAIGVLRKSPATLELAHALVDLGTALNSAHERQTAREKLREGLHLAQQCGATALARRARIELRSAGGRPTEPLNTGLDALTAAEFRVAAMAADGMTNRDIAQALFLTPKTVEWHLGQVYRKLGLHSRTQLTNALNSKPDDTKRQAHERIPGVPRLEAAG